MDSGKTMEPTQEQIGEVITSLLAGADRELLALDEAALAAQWYWGWDEARSAEWNTYKFSDMLEMHKHRCRRWEEHHNGSCCVVERVRDKYLMPRVREFLAAQRRSGLMRQPGEEIKMPHEEQEREYRTVGYLVSALANLCAAPTNMVIDRLTGYLWDAEEAERIKSAQSASTALPAGIGSPGAPAQPGKSDG